MRFFVCWVLLFSFDNLLILFGRFMHVLVFSCCLYRIIFIFVTMLICLIVLFLVCAGALLMSIVFTISLDFGGSCFCFIIFWRSCLVFFVFVVRYFVLPLFFSISVLRCFRSISVCVVASALRVLPAETRLTVYRRHEVWCTDLVSRVGRLNYLCVLHFVMRCTPSINDNFG